MNKEKRVKLTKKYLLIGIACYLISYFVLSRSSHYVNDKIYSNWGNAFYYIPCDEKHFKDNQILQKTHVALVVIYYPVWWVDNHILNGPDLTHFPEDFKLEK